MKTLTEIPLAKILTELDYDDGYSTGKIPENIFKISPSSFEDFFSSPHVWFRNHFLDEDKFEGNTASVLGTTVHYLLEKWHNFKEITDDNYTEIFQYLENNQTLEDFDQDTIESEMETLFELAKPFAENSDIQLTESYRTYILTEHVILAGSLDYFNDNGIVGDYKTTRVKLLPKAISYKHRLQLYCYAYMMRKDGFIVNKIEITYIKRNIDGEISAKTGKTGKAYPPELLTLTEDFTDENYAFIESLLMLCAETFEAFLKQPELGYIFYKDYRFKGKQFDTSRFIQRDLEF